MFGSHRRQGREAGRAMLQSLSSGAIGTRYHAIGTEFHPDKWFFDDPFVMGFSVSGFNLMRAMLFKGRNWSHTKTGEFIGAAFQAMTEPYFTLSQSDIANRLIVLQTDPDFNKGLNNAATFFGAAYGLLKQSDRDPIVLQARELSSEKNDLANALGMGPSTGDEGFQTAIFELALSRELQRRFPSEP